MDGGSCNDEQICGGLSPTVLFLQFALQATQDTLCLGLSLLKHLLKDTLFRGSVYQLLDISPPTHVDHVQPLRTQGVFLLISPHSQKIFFVES